MPSNCKPKWSLWAHAFCFISIRHMLWVWECWFWLASEAVCIIALANTINQRGIQRVQSPFCKFYPIRRSKKTPPVLIRWIYRWLMSWYLKLVTYSLSPSLPPPPALAALQYGAASLLVCQYWSVSAKCQLGTHTHIHTILTICLFPWTESVHSRWMTSIWFWKYRYNKSIWHKYLTCICNYVWWLFWLFV